MKVNSYYPVLCVEDVKKSADFYQQHFNFRAVFENDWYTHLTMQDNPAINLALLASNHASVPEAFRKKAQGVLLNLEVDDVDSLYASFTSQGVPILLELRDEPWGQRHFILSDPSGIMIDIIKLIEPSDEFKAHYNET